jgi:vesicle-fusing ATPase
MMDFSKELGTTDIIVGMKEFRSAVDEIKPQFGVDNDKFESMMRTPLIDYGTSFQRI